MRTRASKLPPSLFVLGAAALFLACPPSEGDDDDPGLQPGQDRSVTILSREVQNFGDPNTRNIEVTATLPEPALWESITLEYRLRCPGGGCDPWDRWGNLEVVLGEGDDAVPVEIGRVITPYGVGGTWEIDVTDLAPVLSGERTFRSNIDTWVSPQGWMVTAKLHYVGGRPRHRPVEVVPVLNGWAVYGDPTDPLQDQLPPMTVPIAADASRLLLRATVTGHGQGNEENCAEFCRKTHTLTAGDESHDWLLWRDDCADNPIDNQTGNWQPNRAGWCPGDAVTPEEWVVEDLSGGDIEVAWRAEDYTNRCGGTEECSDCPLGFGGCEYNGSSHTPPRWSVSLVAIFQQ
jgi:hypothetical protein